MRIVMIGTGYVGLVSGACLSDFGHEVVCVDRERDKIARLEAGEIPIFEPGLDDLVARNVASGRLSFTSDLAGPAQAAEAVFIAVGTPTLGPGSGSGPGSGAGRRGEGHADLSYVHGAAEELAGHLQGYTVVVTKSTVPVGTNREVARRIRAVRPDLDFDVASNPEFLREGAAIEDFMRPDRVVVGVTGERAAQVMREIYRPLNIRETPMVVSDLESAEMIKYAANAFLATKISFINEIADLCERTGADVQTVAKGIGLDGRIGPKFLHPGPGYGGSCFPKDTAALARTAQEHGSPLRIVETVMGVNEARKRAMAARIVEALGGRPGAVAGKRVAVLGVTFKPNTDDMREAPALVIVPALIGAGARVAACDPQGRKEGEALLPGVEWAADPFEAVEGADALVVLTEWNAFRGLSLARLRARMAGDVLVDLRNIYVPAEARAAGFRYTSVGRA